jgi:hypothetical protein
MGHKSFVEMEIFNSRILNFKHIDLANGLYRFSKYYREYNRL